MKDSHTLFRKPLADVLHGMVIGNPEYTVESIAERWWGSYGLDRNTRKLRDKVDPNNERRVLAAAELLDLMKAADCYDPLRWLAHHAGFILYEPQAAGKRLTIDKTVPDIIRATGDAAASLLEARDPIGRAAAEITPGEAEKARIDIDEAIRILAEARDALPK